MLKNGSRVVVVGGGPAGSFFAIHLLRAAKKAGLDIRVTIVEKDLVRQPKNLLAELKGCSKCAGMLSPRLNKDLKAIGIEIPDRLICEEFTHIWIHGLWKNFPLKIPPAQKMYSVFRGSLPEGRKERTQGFDSFLLQTAEGQGADLAAGEVMEIRQSHSKKPLLTILTPLGGMHTIEADFLSVATGVNPGPGTAVEKTGFFRSYQKINPSFILPKLRRSLIFELKPGRSYLRKYMNKEIYLIVSGSKKLLLDHVSLVPKGEYLTVALVGKSIDRASFPGDTRKIIHEFLQLPQIQTILPRITLHNTPVACTCSPYMAVEPSKYSVGDRTAMVGDVLGSRLYRDGLFSAFASARALAETIVHRGVDKRSLSNGYEPVVAWLERDNRFGKVVMGLVHTALKSTVLSRIFYQTFATEMKFKRMDARPLGNALLSLGCSTLDYEQVFQKLMGVGVFFSFLRGLFKTVRNILTELFFGLNWEGCGRYPTVVLKEKREYIKQTISAPLGITLDASPEMERMYAIKIRASSRRIFEELGKFGDANARFLNLRFLSVRRISGRPNRVGSVIRYRLRRFPISMDVVLVRTVERKTLLYEPQELFAKNGKLLFDIAPTNDGNRRLVIYTAFDFKGSATVPGKLFWKLFKWMFPGYAHDVVWNHAICRIKQEAEKRAD